MYWYGNDVNIAAMAIVKSVYGQYTTSNQCIAAHDAFHAAYKTAINMMYAYSLVDCRQADRYELIANSFQSMMQDAHKAARRLA